MSNSYTSGASLATGRDRHARMAGVFLLLTAATTAVMVVLRVAGDTDQATLLESLRAITEARGIYGAGGAVRLLSGVTLLVAAWGLSRTWIIRERLGTPLVPYLFAASGIITAVSGACAMLLAAYYLTEAATAEGIPTSVETAATVRWLTGKIGFAAAGAALVVASVYQWRVGGTLRKVAPASAVIGLAMQFIWIDSATVMHRIVGPAFFIWLIAIGTMLATGRVERHFIAKYHGPKVEPSEHT